MFPSRRAALLFAASIPLALIIIALRQEWWYASLYYPALVLAMIVADMSMTLPRRELACQINVPGRIRIGGTGAVEATLEAEMQHRQLAITALLELDGDADRPTPLTAQLTDGRASFSLPVIPTRRGRVSVVALHLRWRGPLGLVESRWRRPIQASVDIVTNVHGIYEEGIRLLDKDALYGSKSQRLRGEGTEFDKLTDYESGMDIRFIDWKRSARHRKLLSREFRQERNHHVILGFDTGHLMLEPIGGMPRLDHAIRAGMVLGWVSLRQGDLVGGCGFDARFRNYLQPGRGMPYFTRLQHFAAGLDYHAEETNYTLGLTELGSRLRRRALVVVFSEFVDSISAELLAENLQLMARRHVVIFVTFKDSLLGDLRDAPPVTFDDVGKAVIADAFLRERRTVLERVARAGVHHLEVPARELSTALLNRYLLIKEKGLL